ncbi:MAG: acyltransferase [Sphingobacteriaceae bacterium]|nr:acyltransferase [Sphingobacteriaceae bacterium]
MKKDEHIYFRGLNGLRFFAAIAVVITHIELIKYQSGFSNIWKENMLVFELGSLGVIFFFVLSGFLITYLLMQEKAVKQTVAVKKFYIRRILRIWPMYYLVVLLGFLVLPNIHFIDNPYLNKLLDANFTPNFILYLLFLPNLAFATFAAVPHIGQTWSIGVEEQFYLLWPLIVKHSKNVLKALLMVIGILIVLKVIVLVLCKQIPDSSALKIIKPFLAMTKMESMAIGGIGAYYLFNGNEKIKWLMNNGLMISAVIVIVGLVYFTPPIIQDAIYLVYSVLFLVIILNVSSNPKSIFKLENRMFKMLGNISYGIYMYHLIVIAFVFAGLNYFGMEINDSFISQLMVYSLTIIITIFVSILSYSYFEKRFLNLKHKFTIIKSGSNI